MNSELNDDFLQHLRTAPSNKFLSTLKASLDRQTISQAKARRTLFRTAIFAALIGSSAVALAFAFFRGPPAGNSLIHMERSGGGAPKTITSPALGSVPPAVVHAEAAQPMQAAVEHSRAGFVLAGPTVIIFNGQDISRRWALAGSKIQPEFTLTSSSEALAMLCHVARGAATGAGFADIVGASRRILASELETCKLNGVSHVAEVHSGYEAVVLARSKLYGAPKLSARDIFLALAAEVPDPNRPQTLIKNPYRTWNAVDSALLEERIEILGPRLSSATAAALRQTLMEAGCATFTWLAALKQTDTKRYEKVCRTLRDDGVYQARGEKLQEVLETYPNALAVLDYREVAARSDTFAAASVDGIEPGIDTIVAETYAGARAMFLYVNTERARNNFAMLSFVDSYRRSLADSSISTLVPPQRQPLLAPLQDMKF
jgi:phosphate transport system substrate-binding protein